jgi:hypothetical protein
VNWLVVIRATLYVQIRCIHTAYTLKFWKKLIDIKSRTFMTHFTLQTAEFHGLLRKFPYIWLPEKNFTAPYSIQRCLMLSSDSWVVSRMLSDFMMKVQH